MKGRLLSAFVLFTVVAHLVAAVAPPDWVGGVGPKWQAQIGGGIWYQEAKVLTNVAPVLAEYPQPVLIGLRSDVAENGYRFDLNRFDPNAETYNYWPDRASHEFVLQTFLNVGNVRFIWSIPTPDKYHTAPYTVPKTGSGYPWQKPEYYAAYLQYLTAPATMNAVQIAALQTSYDFFLDPSCTVTNPVSELALGGNWANLRARRGHPAPYPIEAVILGIEPYGDAQEAMSEGARYGAMAEKFRAAIRARGGPLATVPLGLNVAAGGAVSDFERPWFKPMLDNVKHADFSYLDLYHHYRFGEPTNELNRVYPTLVHAGSEKAASPGWQNWWLPREQWVSDFSRYLWIYEDTRVALKQYGENPARWKIGCTEHGMAITSRGTGNDMGAGIHWALWLSELMRYNGDFDMNWVFAEQAYAHAQLQFRDDYLTRTPGHYSYKMAQEFIGLSYVTNTFASPTLASGALPEGGNYKSDDVVIRVFKNATNGNYHLFAINKNGTNSGTITGWEDWRVAAWSKLSATNFAAQNAIGKPWARETVKTVSNPLPAKGAALVLDPISVNHIELTASTNVLPVVSVEWREDAKESPAVVGLIRMTRSGPTANAINVNVVFSGTAAFKSDYTVTSTNLVTIPAGAASVDVEIRPVTDMMIESPEFTTLTVRSGTNYITGGANSATVYILD